MTDTAQAVQGPPVVKAVYPTVSTPTQQQAPVSGSGSYSTGGLLTFLLASAAVITLAYLASRLLGNWQVGHARGRRIRVVEGVALGRDHRLLLVAVGKEALVVGTSPNGVNLVHHVADENHARELLGAPAQEAVAADSVLPVGEESIRASLSRMRSALMKSGERSNA